MSGILYISGASGDLGQAVMALSAKHGYDPRGFDVLGGTHIQQIDLADESSVKEAYARTAAEAGPPIGLVNCVGKYEGLGLSTTKLDDFLRIQEANVTTTWVSCIEFSKICQPEASIVNLSSISGRFGSKDAAYGTSKAAIIGLTKSLALAFGSRIRVNAVAPGVMESRMAQRIPDGRAIDYQAGSILGRHGKTEEVAELIMTLLGPASTWMTGSIIDINGGIK